MPEHNRSRIRRGLQGGQGSSLGTAILVGTPALGYHPDTVDRLRGGQGPISNNEILSTELAYRATVPLSKTASPTRNVENPIRAKEGEPGGPANETSPYVIDQRMEEDLARDEWL